MKHSKLFFPTPLRPGFAGPVLLAAVLLSIAPVVGAVGDEGVVVRTFRVEYADLSKVSAAIQPLLSDQGSVTVQPGKGRLTVRDRGDVMKKIADAIERLDRKPVPFRIHVELLKGSKTPFSSAGARDVDDRLRRMFPFKFYQDLGTVDLQGMTGDDITVDLEQGFSVSMVVLDQLQEKTPFGLPPQRLRLDLDPLVLHRAGKNGAREILRTRVVLSENQDVVIGAGKNENSPNGLVLIVRALPED